jgi:hypothetical protein
MISAYYRNHSESKVTTSRGEGMSGRWCHTHGSYTLWDIGQFAQVGERQRRMAGLLPTPINQICKISPNY